MDIFSYLIHVVFCGCGNIFLNINLHMMMYFVTVVIYFLNVSLHVVMYVVVVVIHF